MNIDLQALERALAPLAEIGQDEVEFPAGNTVVFLRVLIPSEERAVQRYAAGAIQKGKPDEDDGDPQGAQEFLDRFRIEVIAYAIVQVGELDLRDVEVIATGAHLDNGKAITVPKVQAMRKLIGKWTRPVLDSVFRKYGEAIDKVEQRSTKAIKFEPADLATEIERLEARLTGLKEEQERRKNPPKSVFGDMMDLATGASNDAKRDREEGLDTIRAARSGQAVLESEVAAEQAAAAAAPATPPEEEPHPEVFGTQPAQRRQPRQPVTPGQGAPPPRTDQPQAAPPAERDQGHDPLGDVQDSFMDSGDADSVRAAMIAEERRILARRARLAQGQAPPPSQAVTDHLRTPQRAPHQAAAEVEAVEQAVEQGADLARATEAGKVGNVQAYRLPAQSLTAPSSQPPINPRPAPSSPAPDGGSRNPRFNPQRP